MSKIVFRDCFAITEVKPRCAVRRKRRSRPLDRPGRRLPVTRTQLVEQLYERHGGLSRREAQALVDLILRVIRDHLAAGERVEIHGFGAFEVRETAARMARHPSAQL